MNKEKTALEEVREAYKIAERQALSQDKYDFEVVIDILHDKYEDAIADLQDQLRNKHDWEEHNCVDCKLQDKIDRLEELLGHSTKDKEWEATNEGNK